MVVHSGKIEDSSTLDWNRGCTDLFDSSAATYWRRCGAPGRHGLRLLSMASVSASTLNIPDAWRHPHMVEVAFVARGDQRMT